MKRFLLLTIFTTAFLSVSSTPVRAIVPEIDMDWSAGAQTIAGDSDVNNNGDTVMAYYFTNVDSGLLSDVTINGVTFTGVSISSPTPFYNFNGTMTLSAGSVYAYSGLSSQEMPFGGFSSGYQTLLNGGASSAASDTLTLTLAGLTVGQTYLFQFWVSNAALVTNNSERFNTAATATSSISLVDNGGNFQGDAGQFIVGTFTAIAAEQFVTFTGTDASNDPMINALQLRALSVPEPASSVLLGLGLLGGSFFFRRRRSA